MIGQTISHYKILAKLGEGGMGIVYKAQDITLNRLAALKFLPHHLIANEAEQARFLQEGQAASALNHPNVCIIYELSKEGDQQFIAMELVEGVTLREKFRTAPLRVNDAITYAEQIGDALQEAHAKGIIHRDIKSDNIMVNAKNQIKVMDFGLAKLKGSLKLTRASSTVGTLSYMAPEQIQGHEADARSDIFSFGVVVYEMLTQRTPFRGEHEAAIMYSVVNEEPEPIEKYRPEASPDLIRILKRSLEKDPEDRYQSVADMVSELRRLKKETSRISHATGKIPAPQNVVPQTVSQPQPKSRKNVWIALAVVLVLLAGGIIFGLMKFRTSTSESPPPEHSAGKSALALNSAMAFRTLQVPFTELGSAGISTDGNWITFPAADVNGKWDIYYMNTSGGDARRVTSDSSGVIASADLSPDGSKIIYDRWNNRRGRSELCIVSSLGGTSAVVAEDGARPRWRPDGQRVGYFTTTSPSGKMDFRTVSPEGNGQRTEFAVEAGVLSMNSFAWSPDGKAIAFARMHPDGFSEIFTRDLESGNEQQTTFDKKHVGDLSWSRNGLLYSSNKGGNVNLWAASVGAGSDLAPVQVTKGSGPDLTMRLSADGKRLIYLQQQRTGHVWLVDASGVPKQVTFDERDIRDATLSPDGKLIACRIADPDPLLPASHVFVMNRDGGSQRQLTKGDEIVGVPRWSPDGRWIATSVRGSTETVQQSHIRLVDASGSEAPRVVRDGSEAWWLDSTNLLVFSGARSWLTTVHGGESEMFYEDSTLALPLSRLFPKLHGDVDLHGEYILYRDLHAGREGWWIAFSPHAKETTTASKFIGPAYVDGFVNSLRRMRDSLASGPRQILPGGTEIGLSPDGTYLLYQDDTNELRKLILPGGTVERVQSTIPRRPVYLEVGNTEGEFIYVDSRLSAKLIVVEGIFP